MTRLSVVNSDERAFKHGGNAETLFGPYDTVSLAVLRGP